MSDLHAHLAEGTTHVCRCWAVVRADGATFGFTDHDRDLGFEGITFRAGTGMTAKALSQTTGLAVDNTEAVGALSDVSVTEADIIAGRFDGAEVRAWLVDWTDPSARVLQFRGSFGELARTGGSFTAELRGLTEALNQPFGAVYQPGCGAVLGDGACKVDLGAPGFFSERVVEEVEDRRIFRFADFTGFDDRWFERGRFKVLTGAAAGVVAMVKNDRLSAEGREVELWQTLATEIAAGDMVRIEAGCDKRAETCRLKFQNFLNFRGFPDIPGDDWLTTFPQRPGVAQGAS
ncbi:DUF2163 domain-containing protein [Acidimangrovimonas sediminis]|uniref:DUF2163 domain-containing protein n=1 Tax=Acidimangrovimonas sediminis TaxID=2056283 RepID=UPI000C7FEBA4|nr:DUF2163 domain-containing protein [Acidimangrovimonas sediminis]